MLYMKSQRSSCLSGEILVHCTGIFTCKVLWQLFALLKVAWQLLRNCNWQTAPFARRIDNTAIHVDSLSAQFQKVDRTGPHIHHQ